MLGRRKRARGAPDQDAVVDRALCVAAVAMLGAVAAGVEEGAMDEAQAGKYLTETHRWLIRESLTAALSGRERALIAKSVRDWTERERLDASWRSESLGVLLWALSALEQIPPYDTRFEQLPSLVPLLAPTADFRRTASLRPAEEIGRARDLAELWHWRGRQPDVTEAVREKAALARADGAIADPIDGDFPAYGKAYRALDAEQSSEAASTAVERQYALNWLCGYAADWDSVPTGT